LSYDNGGSYNKREYPDTDIRIRINLDDREIPHFRRTRFEVYVPLHYQQLILKAKEIARREGRSLSALVLELLRDYVRRHEPGNPQLPLTRFTGESKEERRCSVEGCNEPAAYEVYADHQKMRLCEDHLRDLRRGWLGDRRVNYKSLSWRRISRP